MPQSLPSRGRAPFRNLPMAKGSRTALRLASSLRFLSFNWKLAERCYRTMLLFADVVRSCKAARRLCILTAYESIHDEIFHCRLFLSPSSSFSLSCPVPRAFIFLRLCKMYARSWNVQNLLQIAIFFDNESFWWKKEFRSCETLLCDSWREVLCV